MSFCPATGKASRPFSASIFSFSTFTVSSGSMRILKVCCCSVLSVMVTAMAGPERRGSPRIFTQHATHAAAILAPSRAARRQLPGQELRAPTTRMRDLRTSLPPTTWLSWACAQECPRTRRRVRSAPGKGRVNISVRVHSSRDFLSVTPYPFAVTSYGHKMAPKSPFTPSCV